MAMEIEQPESLEGTGGKFVDKPGTYHMLVTAVDENPATKDGNPIDALKVSLSVLDGTHADQKDRSFDLTLWNPKPEDTTDMSKKKQTRFCLATCLIGAHKPGEKTTVEPTDAVGRQLVAKLSFKQKKNEATGKWEDSDRVDLHYSDIWHVDDQEVAKNKVPLNKEALTLIASQLRKPLTNGAGSGSGATVHTSPAALVGAVRGGSPAVSLTDL